MPWTENEVDQLKTLKENGCSAQQIAEKLDKTYRAVTGKILLLGLKAPETDYRALYEHWRKKASETQRALDKANETKTAVDVLCEQVHDLAPKSYQPPEKCYAHPKKSKSSPQSAVLLFSDTHIGMETLPSD